MNINLALTLGGVMAILVGAILGYLIRWFLSISNRGSIEIEVKQLLLSAKEEAQKIIEDSDKRAKAREEELRKEEKEEDLRLKKIEERLIKKETFLDNLQTDLYKETEQIKLRNKEVKDIREKVTQEKEEAQRRLERIANLSTVDA